jgi:hypothetical protein
MTDIIASLAKPSAISSEPGERALHNPAAADNFKPPSLPVRFTASNPIRCVARSDSRYPGTDTEKVGQLGFSV